MCQPRYYPLLAKFVQIDGYINADLYIFCDSVLTGYDFERQGDTQQLLSSHLLNYLYYQGTEPKYTLEDDLFSLAMIVIAVVLGDKPEGLYFMDSWNSKKVNVKKLQDGRQKLKSLYRPWI